MKEKRGETLVLAQFVNELQFKDIPPHVIESAKFCILDSIGCGLFGNSQKCVEILADYVEKLGGREEATIWQNKKKNSAANAALVNATSCHSFEIDDTHHNAALHSGSVVIPTAIAMSEAIGNISGEKFLTAIVAGYEAGARIGMCVGGSAHFQRGFHNQGTVGTFSAATTAGKILGLSTEEMVNAIGLAGSQAAGLMAAQYGAMAKRFHSGKAAMNGIYSAQLAQMGFTGIPDVIEAKFGGFCSSTSSVMDLEKITQGLGENFELHNVGFKIYSCCASSQTSVDAAKDLLRQGLDVSKIAKILVHTTTATKEHVGWKYKPFNILTAQMNMPFTIAVTLIEGDAFIKQYTPEKISDPKLIALANKVEVVADKELDKLGPDFRHASIVEVETIDGAKWQKRVDYRKGSKENPLTKEELIEKFKMVTKGILVKEEAKHMIDLVLGIEEERNFKEFLQKIS